MGIIEKVTNYIGDKKHTSELKKDAKLYGLEDTRVIDENFMSKVIGWEPLIYTNKDGKETVGDGIRLYRENEKGQMQVVTLPGLSSRENAPKNSGCARMGISYVLPGREVWTKTDPNYHKVENASDVMDALVSGIHSGGSQIIADYFNPDYAQAKGTQNMLQKSCDNYLAQAEKFNKEAEQQKMHQVSIPSAKMHCAKILNTLKEIASMSKNSPENENVNEM